MGRKARPVLDTAETLLLGGGDQLSIAHQCGRRIRMKRVKAENDQFLSSLGTTDPEHSYYSTVPVAIPKTRATTGPAQSLDLVRWASRIAEAKDLSAAHREIVEVMTSRHAEWDAGLGPPRWRDLFMKDAPGPSMRREHPANDLRD